VTLCVCRFRVRSVSLWRVLFAYSYQYLCDTIARGAGGGEAGAPGDVRSTRHPCECGAFFGGLINLELVTPLPVVEPWSRFQKLV